MTPGDRGLPASTATLCWRAGEVLLNYFKLNPKIHLCNDKTVPLACGMEGLGWCWWPLLLVFPWPCCSTSHLRAMLWCWGALGRQVGGLSHLQGSVGILRGSFFQPWKAKHILGVSPAAMAALCMVVPHIWAQLSAATPHLATAAHNAEVTPETANAAYASKTRMVMPGKCWVESFSHSLVPGDPKLVPGARVR